MASRKSNGEGTLYQREDEVWVLQISTIDERGNAFRKSFTGKTKKIVKDKYKLFKEEQELLRKKAAMGLSIVADDITKQNISLSQWVFDWIQVYKKPPVVKETTYASYMQIWEKQIHPFFGKTPLAAVTNKEVQLFYNYLLTNGRSDGKEGGMSPKSVRNVHTMLRSALQMAVGKIILKNPTEETTRPPVPQKDMRVLTVEEMEIFIKEIYAERLRAAIFISLFTGVRMGELLALTWEDVNFKKKSIRINKDYVRVTAFNELGEKDGTKLIVQDTPKSQKSNRIIPLQEDVFTMLVNHYKAQQSSKYPNPLHLIFPSKVGTHTDPRTYQKRMDAISTRCEIQHVNVHALRHTFATRLVEQQVPLRIIQELLGHSSVTTTMRYAHALEEEKEKAINSMDAFLNLTGRTLITI